MTEAPERIWATAYYSQNRSEHMLEWSTRPYEERKDQEYIRADLVDPAAIREAAIREAANAMSPMLRSMISRTEAHRTILALIDKKDGA